MRLVAPIVGRLAVGDVLRDAEEVARLAGRPEDGDLARVQPAHAVRRLERLLGDVDEELVLQDLAILLLEEAGLIGGEQREVVATEHVVALEPGELLARAVEALVTQRLRVLHEDHRRDVVDDRVEEGDERADVAGGRDLVLGGRRGGLNLATRLVELGHGRA